MTEYLISKTRILLLAVISSIAFGQSAEDSWGNLNRLHVGQKIEVVDMKMKSVTGSFVAVSEEAITLLAGVTRISIPQPNVLSVKNREASHRKRNMLLGLAIGAAGGLASGAIRGAMNRDAGETGVFIMALTPIGAGIGAAAGAVLPASQVTVYRAKARRGP